jgi:hypothetical protein
VPARHRRRARIYRPDRPSWPQYRIPLPGLEPHPIFDPPPPVEKPQLGPTPKAGKQKLAANLRAIRTARRQTDTIDPESEDPTDESDHHAD